MDWMWFFLIVIGAYGFGAVLGYMVANWDSKDD